MEPLTSRRISPGAADVTWTEQGGRLVLILSSERSGSTLLRVMLGNHSRIVSPSELWLLSFGTYAEWRAAKPQAIASVLEYFDVIGRPTTVDHLDSECRDRSTEDAYRWMLSFLPASKIFVDKTPGYANTAEALSRSSTFAPFYIWLIRHPLGVVDSHVTLQWRRHRTWKLHDVRWRMSQHVDRLLHGPMTSSVRRRETKWVAQNLNIERFLSTVSEQQKFKLHFEALVREPERTLALLCEHIGVSLEPAMLEPAHGARPMPRGLGDANFHTHTGIDASPAARWRTRFSESALRPDTRGVMYRLGVGSV
jgi:hypothetical protein